MNIIPFNPVLQQIRSNNIKDFTVKCLLDAPDFLSKIPASSTGKYHHKSSLGEGGLVRHILRACHFANYFMEANDIGADDIRGDVIFSSLLLHDIGKKEKYEKFWEYHDHPIVAASMISKHSHLLPPKVFESIKNSVKHHMGKFSGKSFRKPMTEYTLIELIVYNSDYLSSRKELEITQPT